MALLTLESTGDRGEELAMAAGEEIDVPVGFDPEFDAAVEHPVGVLRGARQMRMVRVHP